MRPLIPVRQYLGFDLPARRIDLKFSLPVPHRRDRKPPLSQAELTKRLGGVGAHPRYFLQEFAKILRAINRYPLGPKRRLLVNTQLLRLWLPVCYRLIGVFAKNGGVPDPPERMQQLDLLAETARGLAESFEQVFQHDYEGSRFAYARARGRLQLCALRTLELIKLQQRVLALRYRDLEPRSWRAAHTLYYVMHSYESVDIKLPAMETLLPDRQEHREERLHDVYSSIQAFAILDFSRWPVFYQSFIDTYLGLLEQPMSIEPSGDVYGEDRFFVRCYQSGPPTRNVPELFAGELLRIDCSRLFNSIRADYRDLLKATREKDSFLLPERLSRLAEDYRFLIARMMLEHVDDRSAVDNTAPGREEDLRVYSGLRSIYDYLGTLFVPERDTPEVRRLNDVLAERSALIGEDHTATQESRWHVLTRASGSLSLRTQETRYTVDMRVGSLVAFGFGDDGIRRPRLGRVARIQRPDPRTIIVELEPVADYAEPVVMQRPDNAAALKNQAKEAATGAFLVHVSGVGWRLLVATNTPLFKGSQVILQRGRKRLPCMLGGSRSVSAGLFLHRMERGGTGLGQPRYPIDQNAKVDGLQAAEAGSETGAH